MGKVRIGIVGCGGIGNAHIDGYAANPEVELVAFCDVDLKRAEEKAQKYNAKSYDNYEKMLSDINLDGISVCTPPVHHLQPTVIALQNGINVLCEKPLAITAKEAKEMVTTAEKNKKILMTAFAWRYHKEIQFTKKLMEEGKLGKIIVVRNMFAGYADMSKVWFSKKAVAGGGTILDTGVHSVDFYRFMFGEVANVSARMDTVLQSIEVEDVAQIVLQMESGVIGTVVNSWSVAIPTTDYLEVYGSEGTAVIGWSSMRYKLKSMQDWEKIESKYPEDNPFIKETKNFVDSIQGKDKPLATGADGLRAAEIIEAIYKSVETQVWQKVERT